MTPTARSTKWLRDRGWIVARVEQRLHMPESPFPITRDAFGFADLLAALPKSENPLGTTCDSMIALVQVTSTSNLKARENKILSNFDLPKRWLEAGGIILLHGWARRGSRGKKKAWTLKEKVATPILQKFVDV